MTKEMRYLMDTYGWSELTAWRHVRDREIIRRRYAYQNRYAGAGECRDASAIGKIGDIGKRDFRFLEVSKINFDQPASEKR